MRKLWCLTIHRWTSWLYDKYEKPGAYCWRCQLVWTWGDCK